MRLRGRRKPQSPLFANKIKRHILRVVFDPEPIEHEGPITMVGGGVSRRGVTVYDETGKVVYCRYSIGSE